MADLGIEWTGQENVLEFYAMLKGVPLWKVLKNAAKDALKGAWLATPRAEKRATPQPWAFLPRGGKHGDGRGVYVHIPSQSETTQRRISAYRIAKPRSGYALAAFIPAMKDLDFKTRKPPKAANEKALGTIASFYARKTAAKGNFKARTESWRRAHTHASVPNDYSMGLVNPDRAAPWVLLKVKEYALRNGKYADWASKSLKSGTDRAARTIMRDLRRILAHPEELYKTSHD